MPSLDDEEQHQSPLLAQAAAMDEDLAMRRNAHHSVVFAMLDIAPDWVLANAALAKAYTIYQSKTTVKMSARGAGAAPTTNWS